MNAVIVVCHCSLLFLAFFILIVLVVRTLYSLCRAPIVCPLVIVSNYSHSFCAVCRTTLYCSMCRTIDPTCISSILCTPGSPVLSTAFQILTLAYLLDSQTSADTWK